MIWWLLWACTGDVGRGEAALAQDDFVGAEQAFRAALLDDPADADALYGLGWTFYMAGEHAAADDAFQQLVRLHADSSLGYRGLGSVAASRGDLKAARKHLEDALARAPDDARTLQSLALVDMREGDYEQALRRVDQLLQGDPRSSELLQTRAAILLRSGRWEEALAAADAALAAAEPGRPEATARLTRAHALMAASDGRVSRDNCIDTAAPVLSWLEAADRELDQCQAAGIHAAEIADARRDVGRRRAFVYAACPARSGK